MAMPHSKGPWIYDKGTGQVMQTFDGEICVVSDRVNKDGNGAVIEAAPKLLDLVAEGTTLIQLTNKQRGDWLVEAAAVLQAIRLAG
jgi:hypothetical protein